jgi:hypothetical protein
MPKLGSYGKVPEEERTPDTWMQTFGMMSLRILHHKIPPNPNLFPREVLIHSLNPFEIPPGARDLSR